MKILISSCFFIFLLFQGLQAQIVSGPMLGPVELREAKIWVALQNNTDQVQLRFGKEGETQQSEGYPVKTSQFEFTTCIFTLGGLEPDTRYTYTVEATDSKKQKKQFTGSFHTKVLFQWRTPAPDFTFLTGSCTYFNQPQYDRPGKPYGGDSSIFATMARENASFMMWLGDNWYTREVDFYGNWGLWYRPWHDRKKEVLQPLLSKMSHLAIWDDHDFGPNDYGKSYTLKQTSREVFKSFWMNHSYGEDGQGVYTRYQHNDVDFFMLDDRWWRDSEGMADSLNGQPNPDKRMFGRQQMNWLKEELRMSKGNAAIAFRVIVTGSQVLNPVSSFDKLGRFPIEYQELLRFLQDEKIEGVLFLTGDRHHSEIIKVQPPGLYPLFDITCSPLTSGTHSFGGAEANNPYRVVGVDKYQNYGRISVTGPRNQRKLKVEFLGVKGDMLGEYTIEESRLKFSESR